MECEMKNAVAVVAKSQMNDAFVPISEALVFCLYRDRVKYDDKPQFVNKPRMAALRMCNEDGKLNMSCQRWWDTYLLKRKSNKSFYKSVFMELDRSRQEYRPAPFGRDLPIYIDSETAEMRSLAWDVLEYDVFRGLNSRVPFDYSLAKEVRRKIIAELPFQDMANHFRSVVSDNTVMSLIRQLIHQHTVVVDNMQLVPLRWVQCVLPDDQLVVEVNRPFVMSFPDPANARVQVGALNALLKA